MPPVPLITPEKLVDKLFWPEVSAAVPMMILPAPAIEPTISAILFKLSVAPSDTLTALLLGIEALSSKVPAKILVAPV